MTTKDNTLDEQIDMIRPKVYQYAVKIRKSTTELTAEKNADELAKYIVSLLEQSNNRARIEELIGIVDSQICKPEYHNLLVGKITELRSKL